MLCWLQIQERLRGKCTFYTMPTILALGDESPVPKMAVPGQDGVPRNPTFSLFYTSGSTGLPKGAIYTEEMWCGTPAVLCWLRSGLGCLAAFTVICLHLMRVLLPTLHQPTLVGFCSGEGPILLHLRRRLLSVSISLRH